jgi:hypothetical protein
VPGLAGELLPWVYSFARLLLPILLLPMNAGCTLDAVLGSGVLPGVVVALWLLHWLALLSLLVYAR